MDNEFDWMKSMSNWGASVLFMFYYLLSSSAGQRDAKEIRLMRHVPCSNRMTGETGICTFNWSCVNVAHGVHIGHCVDRFFIGTCCKIPEENVSNKSNSSLSGITLSPEKSTKMGALTSLLHILAIPAKKQETKLGVVKDANHSDAIFKPSPQKLSHNQFSLDSSVTVDLQTLVNKGYWDYSYISNHNRKPILPEVPSLTTFSHTSKHTNELHKSTQPYSSVNHKSQSGYISGALNHLHTTASSELSLSHNKSPSLDATHEQRKPVSVYFTHDQRKPVNIEPSHDQRKPVADSWHGQRKPVNIEPWHDQRKPVKTESWHDQRNPVSTHATFYQREPVALEVQHDIRKPVPLDEDHDQRWPVLEEDWQDEPLPTENIIKLNENLSITENNSTPDDDLSHTPEESKQSTSNHVTTEINAKVDSLLDSNFFQGVQNIDSWKGVEDDIIQSVFTISDAYGNTENKNTLSNINLTITSLNTEAYSQTSPKPSDLANLDTTSTQKFSPSNVSRVCGRPRSTTTGRIVGGRKSHYLRWPWMISLQRYEGKVFKHKCGATLLNQFWAATAAHCVDGKLPKDLILRLGEYNFLRSDELHPHVERRVYVMVIHPEFNPSTYESDLALLRFEDPVQYQANIVPICLPSIMDDITGRIAVVTGWGKLAEEGELPSSLHEVYVPIISNAECERMYFEAGYDEAIRDVFVCAGLTHGGLDACEGDSGGPMVVKGDKGQWVLVGLISWGISCAAPKQPGVYTRVSEFKDWINGIISH